MKWKVLVSAPYLQPVLEEYREQLESRGAELLVPNVNERLSEDELLHLVSDIDGVIAGDDQFIGSLAAQSVNQMPGCPTVWNQAYGRERLINISILSHHR